MRGLTRLALAAALAWSAPAEARMPGPPGMPGPAGPQGVQGAKGDKGDAGQKGETGAQGPQGLQGVPGVAGQPGVKGDAGPQGPQGVAGQAGTPGATGPQGPAGPKASTFVCNTTLADTIAIGLSSGVKSKTGVTCSGVLTTDVLEVYPTSPSTVIEGVAIHHAFPTAANTLRLVYSVPAVTLLTAISIPVAVYAVNR